MSLPRIRRYPVGMDFISFEGPPPAVPEAVMLMAEDGVSSKAMLYARGKEKTVICLMHPRADMTRHYAIPAVVEAGYAFFTQLGRFPGDDVSAATIHELLLADIAAGIRFLKTRGFERIVFLGNSGAASLYALYHAQASTPVPDRLTHTAANDPFDLNKLDMPTGDGFIFLGAHLGAGKTFEDGIDPSVIDECDPLSCDPELDMYNPANGFKEPPATSKYSAEFLARYAAAQHARAARIDALAWSLLAAQKKHEAQMGAAGFADMGLAERAYVMRRAIAVPFMQIYRLDASPFSVDLSIDASERDYGSLMSIRPDLSNYSPMGSKVLNPRVWLSSWSARYSRAGLLESLPKLTMPTLVTGYTGDNALRPQVAERIFNESPAADKQMAVVGGDHFGYPLVSSKNKGGRSAAIEVMLQWLHDRFTH
jgi:hypothetical protein